MPPTLRLRAERPEDLNEAAAILRAGGLVSFPTETVYGLGANALSAAAVQRIFTAKGRPAWDPLIVHVQTAAQLHRVAVLADRALADRVQRLAEQLWPGPLTLLLPRGPQIPDAVTAGRELVGVRVPAHPVAQRLLAAVDLPIAAPSANRFGHVSPTTAAHVLDDLDGRIDAVLDGGSSLVGVESTVVDVTQTPMVVYRAGAIAPALLEAVTGVPAQLFQAVGPDHGRSPAALPSPGVGIRHYAPRIPVQLTKPTLAALDRAAAALLRDPACCVGVLLPADWTLQPDTRLRLQPWGRWAQPETLAAHLFAGLRALEAGDATVILCPLPEPGGLGDALRDRLEKAARTR